ncbi:MAG TPA: bifunctional oligoribonuclease/PAP phosphatase NrnA [Egibacteraceae bacterium]|jgi:bifunctional oligoribonuclease and PAP phosphatase NrnA|nr:bifunctional oligoribonuclease/PAP phosphatase NrnA [Egibacteraceae bacterium]
MAIGEKTWARAVDLLRAADEVALACHVDPDGDALGSMLALKRFLDRRGVRTTGSWGAGAEGQDPALLVPPQYTFLPGLEDLTPAGQFPPRPKLFVAFDTGSPDRLGSLRQAAEAADAVIVIDHHASGTAFGDVRLIDGNAAATAVLVDELIRRMGGELDREMAACLYVGLVTDTGRFQHPSTTPDVMRLGARLIAHDIDHSGINRRVWETHSFGYLKMLGRAMERATLVPDAGLAWTAVRQSDLEDLGITLPETEGLIDVLRAVEAAECVCVVKELPDGSWKVSLRSKGRVDIGRIAAELGGGGHAFAAGLTTTGDLDEVIGRLREALRPALTAG